MSASPSRRVLGYAWKAARADLGALRAAFLFLRAGVELWRMNRNRNVQGATARSRRDGKHARIAARPLPETQPCRGAKIPSAALLVRKPRNWWMKLEPFAVANPLLLLASSKSFWQVTNE